MRLIDADALLKGRQDHDFIDTHIIYNAPTIELIRCKDCKNYFMGSCFVDSYNEYDDNNYEREDDDFCSRAERKEE